MAGSNQRLHRSDEVGLRAEKYVKSLIENYESFPSFIYRKATLTGRNSKEDLAGIDLFIHTEYGKIPFQVKNRKHSGSNSYRKKQIGYICLHTGKGHKKSDQEIINIILREMVDILIKKNYM